MHLAWRSDEGADGLPGGRVHANAAASSCLIERRAGTGVTLRLVGATDWPFRNAAAAEGLVAGGGVGAGRLGSGQACTARHHAGPCRRHFPRARQIRGCERCAGSA